MLSRRIAIMAALVLVALAVPTSALAQVKLVRAMSPEALPLYEMAAEMFEKETGIDVELINAPGAQVRKWEQVITMVAGGVSPDLVDAISTEFVQYAAIDLIKPFDSLMERDPLDRSRLNSTLLDALTWRGKQYVLPYGASGLTLVWNPSHFEEAAVAPPPDAWNDPGWTWENFVATTQKLVRQSAGATIDRFGLGGSLGGWIDLGYHFGTDWVTPDLARWTGSDEPMIDALTHYQDLRWRFHVSPQPGEDGAFLNQRSSMTQIGTWSLPQYTQQEVEWRFAPWPQVGANPPVGVIYPVGMTLLSTSPNEAAAWEFAKFLTTNPEANYIWAKAAGAVPFVLENIPRWAEEIETQRPGVNAIVFGEQVRAHGATIRVRKLSTFGTIDGVMTEVLAQIMDENKPVRLAMEEIASQMQALVDEAAR